MIDLFSGKDKEEHARQKDFCRKYYMLLRTICEDEELRKWCTEYSAYTPITEHKGLEHILYAYFMQDAYDMDVVIHNYTDIIEEGNLDDDLVSDPTPDFIRQLNEEQILACIAWHFRRDHFSEGALIANSIGEGALLSYFAALIG